MLCLCTVLSIQFNRSFSIEIAHTKISKNAFQGKKTFFFKSNSFIKLLSVSGRDISTKLPTFSLAYENLNLDFFYYPLRYKINLNIKFLV